MPLSSDSFLERLILKSQVRKWRLFAILFAVIALFAVFHRYVPGEGLKGDYIARITFDGFIGDDQKVYDLIDQVADDREAKAAIIWLDTPGGSAVGGEEIYIRLRELAQKKPVVAVMRSVAASAGYMISLGADYTLAREGTITGSIGVIVETAEVTGLAEKLGVKPIIIKSAPLKGSPSPFEKSTPEGEQVLKDVILDFYDRFVDIIAERRHLPREQVVKLADGRVYSGKRAAETGLIDAIGGEAEAINWLEKTRGVKASLPVEDVEMEPETSVLDHVLKGLTGKIWQKSRSSLDGLSAIWHPELH